MSGLGRSVGVRWAWGALVGPRRGVGVLWAGFDHGGWGLLGVFPCFEGLLSNCIFITMVVQFPSNLGVECGRGRGVGGQSGPEGVWACCGRGLVMVGGVWWVFSLVLKAYFKIVSL